MLSTGVDCGSSVVDVLLSAVATAADDAAAAAAAYVACSADHNKCCLV